MVSTSFSTLTSTLSLLTPGISRTTVSAWLVSKMSATGTNTRAGMVLYLLLFHFSLLLDLHFLLRGHDRAPALFM